MAKRNASGRNVKINEMNKAKKKLMVKGAQTGSFKHNSTASSNPYRPDPSGGKVGSRFRTRSTIKRLNMYNEKRDPI